MTQEVPGVGVALEKVKLNTFDWTIDNPHLGKIEVKKKMFFK